MQDFNHRTIRSNGIDMHVAEAGQGPLVILVHGFPELWYSWRHQLPALADAGYHAVAPDLRGYGETEIPQSIDSYGMRDMTADIIGLLDALSADTAVLIGHDWGAQIVWSCAEQYPERITALAALSSPYRARSPLKPSEMMRQFSQDKFNFVLYFQEPGVAEAELEADARDTMRRFMYALSGDAPHDLVDYLFTNKPADAPMLYGMPDIKTLPDWLSEADLDYYAQTYARTGFKGALNLYRNLDRNWEESADDPNSGVKQPVLFMAGDYDAAVRYGGVKPMEDALPDLRKVVILPGCGHWIQQERPAEVNAELIDFLHSVGQNGS